MAGMTKEKMAEIRPYRIYKHTLPDGSMYIGLTCEEKLYKRFQYGIGYGYNEEFHNAILDLGWKQVKTEIIADIYCNWYEAHSIERKEIEKAAAAGVKLYNKNHITTKEEPKKKYQLDGVTLIDINAYFPTIKAAADFIGVTKQAVSKALQEDRDCKGWSLAYGDITNKEGE